MDLEIGEVNKEAMDAALDALFAGDQASMTEFVGLCINDLKQFSSGYRASLLAKDLVELRDVTHKYKSVHKLLGLNILVDEADRGKKMLADESFTEDALEESAKTIEKICLAALEHLQGK